MTIMPRPTPTPNGSFIRPSYLNYSLFGSTESYCSKYTQVFGPEHSAGFDNESLVKGTVLINFVGPCHDFKGISV